MAQPRISLILPAKEEEENLRPLADEIRAALEGKFDYEVIVVDDGSTDRTAEVARTLSAENPRIRLVRLAKNQGQTAALFAGFREAQGEILASMDADLQSDPADLPRLVSLIGEWDAVCGYRKKRRAGDTFFRLAMSKIGNGVRRRFTRDSFRDSSCTFRAFRRACVENLQPFTGLHRFLPILIQAQGFRVAETEVANRPRHSGKSKYGLRNRVFRALHDLFAVRWMLKRWIRLDVGERAGKGLPERNDPAPLSGATPPPRPVP